MLVLLWLSVRGLLLERMITLFIKLNRAEVAGDEIILVFFPQLIQLSLSSRGYVAVHSVSCRACRCLCDNLLWSLDLSSYRSVRHVCPRTNSEEGLIFADLGDE